MAAIFAISPGLRKLVQRTSGPISTRSVIAATAEGCSSTPTAPRLFARKAVEEVIRHPDRIEPTTSAVRQMSAISRHGAIRSVSGRCSPTFSMPGMRPSPTSFFGKTADSILGSAGFLRSSASAVYNVPCAPQQQR